MPSGRTSILRRLGCRGSGCSSVPTPPAGRAALDVVGHLRHGITVMDEEIPEIDLAKREFWEAGEAHTQFISEARKAIEKPRFTDTTDEGSSNAAQAR